MREIEKENKLIPAEIKSIIKESKLIKSFNSFTEKYKPKKEYFLSLDFESAKTINKCKVSFFAFGKIY